MVNIHPLERKTHLISKETGLRRIVEMNACIFQIVIKHRCRFGETWKDGMSI